MNTLQTLKELAAQQFGREPDAIDEQASFDQLGIDSLDLLEFLFELEDKFGFVIPQEKVNGVKNLNELAAAIDALIAAGASAQTPTA